MADEMILDNNVCQIKNINDLITQTLENHNESIKYGDCLLNILKKHHLWPILKVKKFKNNDNLVLVHNTYKRNDVENFRELYDQTRSVVLDFSRSIGNNIVVSYANSIPIRTTIENYTAEANDKYYTALDGTMFTVYNYNNIWHIGTTSCPDINKSKFAHPIKTHGYMLDEILYDYFKDNSQIDINDPEISVKLRTLFTSYLNPLYSYEFVMIHPENKHIIDYGNTKEIYHINIKNRITLEEEDISSRPYESIGIKYPIQFMLSDEAINYIKNSNNYGIIARKNGKIYKISSSEIIHREEIDPCNPNIWYNFMFIYMLSKPDYKINDYIKNYKSNFTNPIDEEGNIIDPTYLIHTVMSTIKDIIYNLYISSTKYYNKYNRFKTNMDLDRTFNPIIRFHLAQLRYQQITIYNKRILTSNNIHYYLCNSNNIKNIKVLINHFSNNNHYNIPDKKIKLFKYLNQFLS